jgi:putative transposase
VGKWKKQLLSELPQLFSDGRKQETLNNEPLTAALYQQIGQLKVELDWLKKKAGLLG